MRKVRGLLYVAHIHKYSIDSDRLIPRDTKLVYLNLSQEGCVSI